MNNLDERIRESLSSEDQALLAKIDADESLYRDVISTFQGRMRWLNILSSIVGFGLFGVFVFSWLDQSRCRTNFCTRFPS
jgi:hypothetical protein